MDNEKLNVEMITGDTPLTFDPGITWVLGKMNRVEELEAQLAVANNLLALYAYGVWTTMANGKGYVEFDGVLYQGGPAIAYLEHYGQGR